MTFPIGTVISTANLNAGTDSPALARADLLQAVEAVNDIIDSANQENGVLVLTGSGKIPNSVFPTAITLSAGVQVINPQDGVVNIRDVLRLQPQITSNILSIASPEAGDLAYASDGAAGQPCLAFYDGTSWKRVTVGATISAT